MKIFGPYELERDTYASPLVQAIADVTPGRGQYQPTVERHLVEACRDAGIQLGAHDSRILRWLADQPAETAQVVIGLISRAYAAGGERTALRGHDRTAPGPGEAATIIEHEGRQLRVIPMDQHDRRCDVRVASAQGTTPEVLHCHFCGFCYPKAEANAASKQAKEASRGTP